MLNKTQRYAGLKFLQLVLFSAFIATQCVSTHSILNSQRSLPTPLKANDVRLLDLGEPAIAAKLLGFWLLSFDTHAGEIVQYDTLDYDRLVAWLSLVQDLDLSSDDASMVASGVFIEAKDAVKARRMVEFVNAQFLKAPAVNWRWLSYATLQAKYRLHDLPLAREMARNLLIASTVADIPAWARDLEILILQDLGEFEAAIALTTTLIEQGAIKDADELRFLTSKIKELQHQLNNR